MDQKLETRIKDMQHLAKGTLLYNLKMELVDIKDNQLTMTMPVTRSVHQPFGLLHGGATAALIETVASTGSNLFCPEDMIAVGIELNCSHLRSKTEGTLTAIGTAVHLGRRIHAWEVRVSDEAHKLIATGRCTLSIIPKQRS
jgi:uncharacterized protein (TIGR00369 family)